MSAVKGFLERRYWVDVVVLQCWHKLEWCATGIIDNLNLQIKSKDLYILLFQVDFD